MTDEEFRRRIACIESWANQEVARYRAATVADPKPGSGEPGHTYEAVKAMAYEQRYAREIAVIEASMRWCVENVERDFYRVPREPTDDPDLIRAQAYFDRIFSPDSRGPQSFA